MFGKISTYYTLMYCFEETDGQFLLIAPLSTIKPTFKYYKK